MFFIDNTLRSLNEVMRKTRTEFQTMAKDYPLTVYLIELQNLVSNLVDICMSRLALGLLIFTTV